MKNRLSRLLVGAAFLFALVLMTNCAPMNTTFESAPTLPPGKFEFQGNVSRTFYADADDTNDFFATTKNIGIGLGMGVVKNIDVRFRAEALFMPEGKTADLDFSRAGYFSFSPKFSFFKNECLALKGYYDFILAFENETNTPLGFNDFGVQVLYTPIQKRYFDLTLGGKIGAWTFPSTGFSLGMGFGRNIKRSAFRPLIGVIVGHDQEPIFNAGIGCTVVFGGKKGTE